MQGQMSFHRPIALIEAPCQDLRGDDQLTIGCWHLTLVQIPIGLAGPCIDFEVCRLYIEKLFVTMMEVF